MAAEKMDLKKSILFIYIVCYASFCKGMVLEKLNEPDKDPQMPVQILDESGNFNEFLNLPQNENLKYQNALQNLLQPWQNIPYILYTEDELSDFADELMLPTDDDYNKNVFISAMKRALGYNNRIRQRLQKNKARQANSYKSIIMACTPTREDIFRLLLAAGEIQSNGGERILNICDKKRPLKVVVRKSRYTAK